MKASSASPALPVPGRIDEPRFQLGHAFAVAVLLHLLLLLTVTTFPDLFASPRLLLVAEPEAPAPVKFTFINVPDDHVVAENPDADLISDKNREESGPVPRETTPEGKLPPAEGNTSEKIAGGVTAPPPAPPRRSAPELPRPSPPVEQQARKADQPAEKPVPRQQQDPQQAQPPSDEPGPTRQAETAQESGGGAVDGGDVGDDRRQVEPRQERFSRALDQMAAQPLPTDLQAVATPSPEPPLAQKGDSTRWAFNNPDPAYPVKVGSISFDSKGADFGPWLAEFHARVLAEWTRNLDEWRQRVFDEIVGAPTAQDPGKWNAYAMRMNSTRGVTGVVFEVTREGAVRALDMVHPSGTTELDRSVQKTLRNVLLPPLPDDYPDAVLPIRAGFYYNVEPPR